MSEVKTKLEGFAVYEDFCDCDDYGEGEIIISGWLLYSYKAISSVDECDDCGRTNKQVCLDNTTIHTIGLSIMPLSPHLLMEVKKALGRDLVEGEWISVDLSVNVTTPDDFLLETGHRTDTKG